MLMPCLWEQDSQFQFQTTCQYTMLQLCPVLSVIDNLLFLCYIASGLQQQQIPANPYEQGTTLYK